MSENQSNTPKKDPEGYKGALRERLIKENVGVWSVVEITKQNAKYSGTLCMCGSFSRKTSLVITCQPMLMPAPGIWDAPLK